MKMKNSIFRKSFPLAILFLFLDTICPYHDDYYLFDDNVYRTMLYNNKHIPFLETLKPFYYPSQCYYLNRPIQYNSIATIIRQICNYHAHSYKTDKLYNRSEYTTRYFIERPKNQG
jgi:SNF2 family DNA or RNA helicase